MNAIRLTHEHKYGVRKDTECLRQRTKYSRMEQSWKSRKNGKGRVKRKEKTEEERDEI
jgi:hypothetical protein